MDPSNPSTGNSEEEIITLTYPYETWMFTEYMDSESNTYAKQGIVDLVAVVTSTNTNAVGLLPISEIWL